MTTREVLAELSERMKRSAAELHPGLPERGVVDDYRLLGKAEGLLLAHSFVADAVRILLDDTITTVEQLDALPSLTIIGVADPHQPDKLYAVQKRCDGQWGSYKVDGTRPALWLLDTAAHQPFRARVLWRPDRGAQ